MTCCAICKLTKRESIEENVCGCPQFFANNEGEITIIWRGYPFKLKEFMEIQRTANPNIEIKKHMEALLDEVKKQ